MYEITLDPTCWTNSIANRCFVICVPEEGYGLFVYLDHPGSTMRLELVSTALTEAFETWWAGGALG